MMRFVCDPVLKPGDKVLAGKRTVVGEAFAWQPGDNIDAFLEFVGDSFVAVGGQVYLRQTDGSLSPFDVARLLVIVKPPAGELLFLHPNEFQQHWASLVTDDTPEVIEAVNAPDPVATVVDVADGGDIDVEDSVTVDAPVADAPKRGRKPKTAPEP